MVSAHGLVRGGVTEAHRRGAPKKALERMGRYAPRSSGLARDLADPKAEAAGAYGKPHLQRHVPDDT
jgi:hypothetical protein